MRFLLLICLSFILLNASVTKEQIKKLNSSLIQECNNTLIIEEYYKIVLKKEIETPFDKEKHKILIQKNLATMKRGIINQERFISLYSAVANEIEGSIFMPLLNFGAIDHVEFLFSKPKNYDILIKMNINTKGMETTITSKQNTIKKIIPFENFFIINMPKEKQK